jgi:hypothetical protein
MSARGGPPSPTAQNAPYAGNPPGVLRGWRLGGSLDGGGRPMTWVPVLVREVDCGGRPCLRLGHEQVDRSLDFLSYDRTVRISR